MIREMLALGAALALGGCATPYGTPSLAGGYRDYQVNRHLVKVSFWGNGYIKADKVQTYTLYRCAEVARDAKKPYFALYDSLSAAARDRPTSQPRVGTLGGKPIGTAFVPLLDEAAQGALETRDVLGRLEPEIRRSEPPVTTR